MAAVVAQALQRAVLIGERERRRRLAGRQLGGLRAERDPGADRDQTGPQIPQISHFSMVVN